MEIETGAQPQAVVSQQSGFNGATSFQKWKYNANMAKINYYWANVLQWSHFFSEMEIRRP